MRETNGNPQTWNPAKVRKAFADLEQLVAALGRDESGDAYHAPLDPILWRLLGPAEADDAAADRLAYMLYGATLFGLSAIATAEILGSVSRQHVLELIHRTLDMWLEDVGAKEAGSPPTAP